MARKEFFELFLDELKDIYDSENQIVKALPKMIEAASSQELKEAFEGHLEETKQQVRRLARIFEVLELDGEGESCEAMKGLIKEGEEVINRFPKSAIRDAGLIARAQRIEHYEIAVYGTLKTFAKEFDLDEVRNLLQISLDEEGGANKKLTKIAEGGLFTTGINAKAQSK